MFGFWKKKEKSNPAGKQGGNSPSSRSPWEQAAALMDQGKAAEALDCFGQAALQTRDLSHMDLAERWLGSQALLDRAGEEAVCRFAALLTQVLDPMEPNRRQRLWDGCLSALRALGDDTAPRPDITNRYTAECILLRHMGRMEEALTAAREGISRHGAASCYTFAGLCCMDMDNPGQAEEYVLEGLKLDPKNLAPCNDLGDYFFRNKALDKAIEYYAMVVDRGELQDVEWAEPSLFFCRWLVSGDPVELERLALLAASQPRNQRAAQLRQAVGQRKA